MPGRKRVWSEGFFMQGEHIQRSVNTWKVVYLYNPGPHRRPGCWPLWFYTPLSWDKEHKRDAWMNRGRNPLKRLTEIASELPSMVSCDDRGRGESLLKRLLLLRKDIPCSVPPVCTSVQACCPRWHKAISRSDRQSIYTVLFRDRLHPWCEESVLSSSGL